MKNNVIQWKANRRIEKGQMKSNYEGTIFEPNSQKGKQIVSDVAITLVGGVKNEGICTG